MTQQERSGIVAGLDIGATFCGYAFSGRQTGQPDLSQIKTNVAWAANKDLFSLKTPSALLMKPEETFHSFGYEAEDKYAELTLDNTHHGWRLFKNFKSVLYKSTVGLDAVCEDVTGQTAPAKDIFAMTISYMKGHLVSSLSKSGWGDDYDLLNAILWVIPIPPGLSENARILVEAAANQSSIVEEKFSFPDEDFVALLHGSQTEFTNMKPLLRQLFSGEEIMLLDLGGGTTEVSVFEVISPTELSKVYHESKDSLLASSVNRGLLNIVSEIVGRPLLNEFKEHHYGDYMELLREIETRKRQEKLDDLGTIAIAIPATLTQMLQDKKGQSYEEAAANSKFSNSVTWAKRDRLRLDVSVMNDMFADSTEAIANQVAQIMAYKCKELQKIVITGGYADNAVVQRGMLESLIEADIHVVFPEDCGVAVLKGAVLFGLFPSLVTANTNATAQNRIQDQKSTGNEEQISPVNKAIMNYDSARSQKMDSDSDSVRSRAPSVTLPATSNPRAGQANDTTVVRAPVQRRVSFNVPPPKPKPPKKSKACIIL